MSPRKIVFLFTFVCVLMLGALGQSSPSSSKSKPVFPETFGGWVRGAVQTGTDPSAVDPAQSRVLKEYGFTDFETADYSKDGRTLKLKAARFQDATGAYGAFTFYREPKMQPERVGTMAVSTNERVLFFRDNFLVDAIFDHVTGMSGSELRELAGLLPSATGPTAKLPSLPQYLPREKMVENSARFIIGPAAYEALGIAVAAPLIDFSKDPEILTSKVATSDGVSDFMLISYPTPQIAIERLRAFESGKPQNVNTYEVKRTGPIIAMSFGSISSSDARSLLGRVNYEAEVTWNEPTSVSKRDNIGNLVIAAFTLAFVIFVFSVGSGVIFGFWRTALSRLFPKRFPARSEDGEFIRLDLR
jgi:hypothetical protein